MATPMARAAARYAVDLLDPTIQRPVQSLLSQAYGKPVELNIVKLKRPHLNSDVLASVVTQHLKDRRNTPRRVLRDVVWKARLPTTQAQVPSIAQNNAASMKMLKRNPAKASVGRRRAPIASVISGLRLKQVSSIQVSAAGRLTKRLTANRAATKVARKGLTAKGPGYMLRGFRKANLQYSLEHGKRRVGAFGIKVHVGHS